MEQSIFDKAQEIQDSKQELEEQLKKLKRGSWGLGIKIKLKTGYADMGRDLTVDVELEKDISVEICAAIQNIISRHIDALNVEFKKL